MSRTVFLAVSAALLVVGCGSSGLNPLVLDGQELHVSLVTQRIDQVLRLHVPRAVLQGNPQVSTDPEFVEAISRGGSQGRLGSEGVKAALYALYRGESEVGFYGLETQSTADADRLEGQLRGIWARNASFQRARVHREGRVLVVVWTDGVSAACWEAVNAVVAKRLGDP